MILFARSSVVRSFVAAAAFVACAGVSAAAPTPAPAGTYRIDSVHSGAFFEVGRAGGISRFMGRFKDISGELQVDVPERSRVKVDIKTDSVDSNSEALDRHLKSPDFFNAVQFPTLSFTSTAMTLNAEGEGSLAGNLTLRGVTKPVTFKLRHVGTGRGMRGETRAGYVATATIKRSEFGMTYGTPGSAIDEVDLRINIEAIRQ